MIKLALKDMQKIAKDRGGKCLSKEYLGSHVKLRWKCNEGHEWEALPTNVKSRKSWCPFCAGKGVSISDVRKLVKKRRGVLHSKVYINAVSSLHLECEMGHLFHLNYNKMQQGRWCPSCSEGLSERFCREVFSQIFLCKFTKFRPKWLINDDGNGMELDGYNKQYKLAFEYQGIQHFEFIKHFHRDKKTLVKRINDDKRKLKLCRENGVRLIIIPTLGKAFTIVQLKDYVLNECRQLNIALPDGVENREIDFSKAFSSNSKERLGELVKIITSKKGKLITKDYRGVTAKLEVQCKEGHVFFPYYNTIMNGNWCPECAGLKRLTIEEMHQIAKLKSGECISKSYVNARTKLEWQCSKGHRWLNTPDNIRRGQWCPECSGLKRLTIEEMQQLAELKSGKCISLSYVNARTKLEWECNKGHRWLNTPDKIKRGQWCPECYKISTRK